MQDDVELAVGGDDAEGVHHDERDPEVAFGVEGDAVRVTVGPEVGAVVLGAADGAVLADEVANDTAAHGLGDVDVFLVGVEADAVGEEDAFGEDAGLAAFNDAEGPVGDGVARGVNMASEVGGVRDPNALLRIDVGEVGRGHGTAVHGVGDDVVQAVGVEALDLAVADVGDDHVAGGVDADAVWGAADLADVFLRPVGVDARAMAFAMRTPDRAVVEGHDAFGAHKVVSELGNALEIDVDVHDVVARRV